MSFSLEFIRAILFLLPGMACLFAILSDNETRLRRSLPVNGSLIVVVAAPFFALCVHAVWGLIFFAAEQAIIAADCCRFVGFDLNLYRALLIADDDWRPGAVELWYVPSALIVITMSPWGVIHLFRRYAAPLLRRFQPDEDEESPKTRVDWLRSLLRASRSDDRVLVCYLVSRIASGEATVGYSGEVEDIALDGNRDIRSITLYNCVPFTLTVNADGVRRREEMRATPIPFMNFQASEIQNVAFEIQTYVIEDDNEPAVEERLQVIEESSSVQ